MALDEAEYRILKTRVEIALQDSLERAPFHFQTGNLIKEGTHPVCYQMKLMCVSFLLHTGARFAEALGVTSADVHPEYITINKTWDYKTGTGFGKTKNDASIRDVAVDRTLVKQIKRFIKWKNQYYPNSDLPILVEPHTNIYNDTYNNFFKMIQRKYGIKKNLTLHKIRHTYISYLLNEGISAESIAKQVGHTDTSMITKVYGHLLEERAAVDKLKIRSLMR
jgi:integrase